MARAKQTNRAEARRRYRQTTNQPDELEDVDGESVPAATAGSAKSTPARTAGRPGQPVPARPGFLSAFRDAYHRPNIREDLVALPKLLTSRALLAGIGITLAAALIYWVLPTYDGSTMAFQLIVVPGAALVPQLVTGFFAPRASYLLGLIVGIVQGLAFATVVLSLANRTGQPIASDAMATLLSQSFLSGPVSSLIFASMAAWYRRFLALSSPRRPAPSGRGGRTPAKQQAPARRPGR